MLDWNRFESLPGDKRINFENLCRAIVRLHFNSCGEFSALKNQPGIEFQLNLNRHHSALGGAGRRYGWQCKWFNRTQTGNLSAASKKKIEESLKKTQSDITDWVLWTPYTLSKQDQEWFRALAKTPKLHLWDHEDVNNYLGGPAEYLRSTFFGELILTPEELAIRHQESVQPIKSRWIEEAHQAVNTEQQIREMLGEADAWSEVSKISNSLDHTATLINKGLPSFLSDKSIPFLSACTELSEALLGFHKQLEEGDLESTLEELSALVSTVNRDVASFPKHLRNINSPDALQVTNALDDMYIAQERISKARGLLRTNMVAVLADAGAGKTQMAAQLTAPSDNRPAGILFRGKNLKKGETLDDLSKRYHIDGRQVSSIEKILQALDSAAIRSRCRLPLVIDGLNESEEPRDWHDLLSTLSVMLTRYPNVLVVCTLRTGERRRENNSYDYQSIDSDNRWSFADIALPKDIQVMESDGFGVDTEEAVEKYFSYYKIKVLDDEIALDIFNHPLNLRIFCDLTNPKKEKEVQIDHAPASLTILFEKYLDDICERISQMSLVHKYTKSEVSFALYHLGLCLWDGGSRDIHEQHYKAVIKESSALDWSSSLINLLSEEGVIFRNPGSEYGEYLLSPVYDLLGGYLIADGLIKKYQKNNLLEKVSDPEFLENFTGENHHDLAVDVFRSLATLIPHRMNGIHWWQHMPDGYIGAALFYVTDSEKKYINQATVDAIKERFYASDEAQKKYFPQLQKFRGAISHPLNARFFDDLLTEMSVTERDLSWTEWLRKRNDLVMGTNSAFKELEVLESCWKETKSTRGELDYLKLLWVKWFLTSTDHRLRDAATRTIYWFGRGCAQTLFDESVRSLTINDPYVPERMLAASYGVAMALHTEHEGTEFKKEILPKYARKLYDSVFSIESKTSTTHILICEYASKIIELAALYNKATFSKEVLNTKFPFQRGTRESWGEAFRTTEEGWGHQTPFRMDFSNYTIGRLVPERRNYDFDHEEYKSIASKILWRVEQLGWSYKSFGKIDDEIPDSHRRYSAASGDQRTDRYGKKYSWIAYHEMAGMIYPVPEYINKPRHSLIDIDPSFPKPPEDEKLFDINLLGSMEQDNESWVESGESTLDLTDFLSISDTPESGQSWVVLDGYINQREKTIRRDSFCFTRSFFVPNDKLSDIRAHLEKQSFHETGWRLPNAPEIQLIFSGEIGWCTTHPEINPLEMSFVVGRETSEVEVPKVEHFLDGKLVSTDIWFLMSGLTQTLKTLGGQVVSEQDLGRIKTVDSMEKELLERDVYERFEVYSPVCNISCTLETASHDAESYTTLSRGLIDDFQLSGKPQSRDLFDKNNQRATRHTVETQGGFQNKQRMFLIREDLLKQYLGKHDVTLLWGIWGERNLLNTGSFGTEKYQVFSHIKCYP